jgi:hypothetical protein
VLADKFVGVFSSSSTVSEAFFPEEVDEEDDRLPDELRALEA